MSDIQPPRAARYRPTFDETFQWFQHVHVGAHLEEGTADQHVCPVGWTVRPLLVELPFDYAIRVCHGCGAAYLAPEGIAL